MAKNGKREMSRFWRIQGLQMVAQGIAVAVVSNVVLGLGWNFRKLVLDTFPFWSVIGAFVAAGIGLYVIRAYGRFYYGATEMLFGMGVGGEVFFSKRFDYESLGRAEWITVIGALYIIVSGLDNARTGWKG